MNERIALNKRRTRKMGAAFWALVFVVVAVVIGLIAQSIFAGLVAGIVVASAWTAIAWFRSDNIILDLSDAQDANARDHARFFNVVNGLRAAMGLPALDLYIVDDPAMNALAVGRDPNHAAVVVTNGLLENTTLVELEAVLSLQLYRIKTHATAPESFVVPTFGTTEVLAELADQYDWLARLLHLPSKWVERAIERVHGWSDDFETDIQSTMFTRYPPALAAVLSKMAGQSAPAVAAPVTAHLWMAPPLAPTAHPNASRLHAPLRQRVAVLEEL